MPLSLRFLRSPTSGVVVLTLALAIGANTAVFAVVDATLLRAPPFADVDRLAVLFTTHSTPTSVWNERWSYPRYETLRRSLPRDVFADVASFSQAVLTITGDIPEPTATELVAPSYFATVGVAPALGRTFREDENTAPGAHPVALISNDLWRRRFASDPAILGRTIEISSTTLTIVGVMPAGFRGLTGRAELWMPAAMAPILSYRDYLTTNQNFISVVARLRPGVALARAREAMGVLGPAIQSGQPSRADGANDRFSATAVSLNEARIDVRERRAVLLLLGAVGFLLLLACANVANLLLAVGEGRRREHAIRSALGATRAQLARSILAESAILAALGGVTGTLLSTWLLAVLPLPPRIPGARNMYGSLGDFATPGIDPRVAGFVIVVTVLVALACGSLPALQPARVDFARDLKEGAAGSAVGSGLRRLSARSVIVALETAMALVLLAGGGLMLESFRRLRGQQLGFEPEGILTFLIRPSDVAYPPGKAPALIERVLAEIDRVPGVVATTVDGCAPMSTGCASSTLRVIGRPEPKPDEAPPILRHYVAPDHFRVLNVPLLRGRRFTAQDRAGSPRVAIINDLAARRFFPNEDPIGRRVWFGGGSNFDRPDSAAEIVGIVGDVAYQPLDERPMQPDFYTPYRQFTYVSRTVLVRTTGDPAAYVGAIRRAVRAANPELALFEVRTMEQVIGDSLARRRFNTLLLAGFAFVAIIIAATGIYAVVAHSVARRTREVGIRVALGSTMAEVVALLVRQGMALPAIGLAVGLGGAFALTRALRSMLFGVSATSPMVFGLVTVLLGVVALLACYLPARRASSVDPVLALKADGR